MIYANDNYGKKITAFPGSVAECPLCNEELIPRCGQINVWHWAHKSVSDCDPWGEHETAWHIAWKDLLPPERVEVTIEKDGILHRADYVTPEGMVIEFQQSNLSVQEILERESFYGNMSWVFNIQPACETTIEDYDPITDTIYETEPRFDLRYKEKHQTFRWKHAKRHIAYATKRVYLDLNEDQIFLLRNIYLGPPCGGWGYVYKKENFIGRLRGTNRLIR